MGRLSIPDIVTRFSLPSTIRSDVGKLEAQKMPSELSGHHTEYQYPFEQMNWQLAQWYEKILKIITDETHFYYWDNDGVKNPVRSFDEFLNMNGDDLILLAKSGKKLSGVFKAEERAEMLQSLRIQIKEEMKQAGFFKTT